MKNLTDIINVERECDYTHGNPNNKLGKFFNKISFPSGQIRPSYAYLGFLAAAVLAQVISLSGISLYGGVVEYYDSKKAVVSCEYKNPNFPFPSTLYGFDLDENGSIDKITEISRHGGLIKIPHKYSPEDEKFFELKEILEENKK